MEKKKNGKKVKVEGGELPIRCPKCGSQMLECIQTKKYNKNRQTLAHSTYGTIEGWSDS